ncbi:cytochrome P450 [Glonium stellatum]|uniref:Cytochrome P450 n=1 Tax=Glonium stellatum TaxID=574774 RepID=A0A8E2JMV0_9PEZI|nr:cytochrome P450 [Glonium stellatum]
MGFIQVLLHIFYLFIFIIISTLTVILYNLCIHSLHHFPGPPFAAASPLPFIYHLVRGSMTTWLSKLHARYGPVVRISPFELSYIDACAWKDIFGHRVGRYNTLPRDPRFYGPETNGRNGIIRSDQKSHARLRRLLAHAFSEQALREQEGLIREHVDKLVLQLGVVAAKNGERDKEGGGTVDIVRLLNLTTFDIMGDLTFGESLNMQSHTAYTPWVDSVFSTYHVFTVMMVLRKYFPILQPLASILIPKRLQQKRQVHIRYSQAMVDRRLARAPDRPDIWSFVLRHTEDDGKGMSVPEMHATSSTLMIAGTRTTASALSGLLYYLLKDTSRKRKLVDEIRNAFSTEADMTAAMLSRLPYLQACIDEALRLYPPIPTGNPRVVPSGGVQICGKWVPEGTSVFVHHYAAYHSPTHFHHASSFLPERWLGDDPTFSRDEKSVFKPFSYGPRNCLGKNLAYHEIKLIATSLLWHFDLSLADKSGDWARQLVYVTWDKPPLRIHVKKRLLDKNEGKDFDRESSRRGSRKRN